MDHCMNTAFSQNTTEPVSLSSLCDCRVAMLAVHWASACSVPPSAQLSFVSLPRVLHQYRGKEKLPKVFSWYQSGQWIGVWTESDRVLDTTSHCT